MLQSTNKLLSCSTLPILDCAQPACSTDAGAAPTVDQGSESSSSPLDGPLGPLAPICRNALTYATPAIFPRWPQLPTGLLPWQSREQVVRHLLCDPKTHKPPVWWGRDQALALKYALNELDDDDFAMALARMVEQLTPEFVVHFLADPSVESPRWSACLEQLTPYVLEHTRDIERTPTFVAAGADTSYVTGVVRVIDAWLRSQKLSDWDSKYSDGEASRFTGKEDAVRFFFEYVSDAEFVSPFSLELQAYMGDNHADLACRILPCLIRRNGAWIDRRQEHPLVHFAQQHGLASVLKSFALQQRVALLGHLATPALTVASVKAYGPHLIAMVMRRLPRQAVKESLEEAGKSYDDDMASVAKRIADVLSITLSGAESPVASARLRRDPKAARGRESESESESEGDFGVCERTGSVLSSESCDSLDEMASAVCKAADTDEVSNAEVADEPQDTRMHELGALTPYWNSAQTCKVADAKDEARGYDSDGNLTNTAVAPDGTASPGPTNEPDEITVEGEKEFARTLVSLGESLVDDGNADAVIKVVERVYEIEDHALRLRVWHRIARPAAKSRNMTSLVPQIFAAIPAADRDAVRRYKDHDLVETYVASCLASEVPLTALVTPADLHLFMQEKRKIATDLLAGAQLPWRTMEMMSEALDDAGKLTLLDIVREVEEQSRF